MVSHEHPGLFIAVEGLDGSGSSSHAALLANVLEKDGYRVLLTREPTNSLIGGMIRARLAGEWVAGVEALQLLFAADRAAHLDQVILPALAGGRIVITDRYVFSAVAYGSLEIPDTAWLSTVNDRFIVPDLTFLVEVRPKICALRLKERHYELELYTEEQKLAKVWQTYEELATSHKDVVRVSGERPEFEILSEMKAVTKKYLKEEDRRVDREDEKVLTSVAAIR